VPTQQPPAIFSDDRGRAGARTCLSDLPLVDDQTSKMPPGAFVWTAIASALIIAALTALSLIH